MITHHLNDEDDFRQGGYFADDHGRSIARWEYDADSRTITVSTSTQGTRVTLPASADRTDDDELERRFIDIAKNKAEELAPGRFDD